MKVCNRISMLLVVASLIAGCASTVAPRQKIHHAYYSMWKPVSEQNPQKMLLLPPEVRVSEISAGGVIDEVPEWSEVAKENIERSVRKYFSSYDLVEMIEMPGLSAEEEKTLNEHVALYYIVGDDALTYSNSPSEAWKHKSSRFDYTLGSGLNFLKDKTGAHVCLIILANDSISTSGRKAMSIAGAILGMHVMMGQSFMVVGVIDLSTGDIVWINYLYSYADKNILKQDDADFMINSILKNYPGIDDYLKFHKKNYPAALKE